MSQSDKPHLRRLMRWILISIGIHAVILAVTSIGWFISLAKGPEPAAATAAVAKPAAGAAAPAAEKAPEKAATEQPAGALPPVPKARDPDKELFGKPETDPAKLREGPDTRPDLDALK
jgi:hypothetical protein